MRTCIKCGKVGEDSIFVFNATKGRYLNTCKECMSIYLKAYLLIYRGKEGVSLQDKNTEVRTVKIGLSLPRPTIIIENDPSYIASLNIKTNGNSSPKRYSTVNYPTEEDWIIHKREYEKRWKNEKKTRKIAAHIRSRLWELLTGTKKYYSFMKMLGCDETFLRNHLESQFKEGMTWDNYGQFGWHVDHIIPLSSFNLEDPQEQLKCSHWTNLQPLWWYENLSKGNKML